MVGQDIMKGVYYALVLTVRNLVNFNECQKTKQRECPIGVLYTYLKYQYSHYIGNHRYRGVVIHICVGLMRCSFLTFGLTRASNRGASDSAGLHALFLLSWFIFFNPRYLQPLTA